MTTRRWVGGQGSFTDVTEWSPGGVPGLGDTAVLGAGANVSVASSTILRATVVLADPTATLSIQQDASSAPTAGAVALAAVNGGGTLTGVAGLSPVGPIPPGLEGGLLLVGSPDPARPFLVQSTASFFSLQGTMDVVGAVTFAGSTYSKTWVTEVGTTTIEPGGSLVFLGQSSTNYGAYIAGGTLDDSQAATFGPIGVTTFDGGAGTLIIRASQSAEVSGFRNGDVIDVKGIVKSGTLTSANGYYGLGTSLVKFDGPTAVGATYTATPDGTGGTFVTVSGPNAGRAAASQYIFGFALSAASVAFGKDGRALLTAPNGTVTDVTGVATLQFLDGTINGRTGSPVDPLFYYARNPDVWAAYTQGGLDATRHYDQFGWKEGRDPDALFSTRAYLAANPDVAAAGINPALHYDQVGWHEGRDAGVSLSAEAYRAAYGDVAGSGIDPLVHYLEFGAAEGRYDFPGLSAGTIGDFDPKFYLAHNPDVAAAVPAGIAPASFALQHFLANGVREARDPDALFSLKYYFSHYPDIVRAAANPLLQFEQYGWREGRDPGPGFSTAGYLAHNPDVAAAGIDPLQHYLQYGMAEGRAAG